MTGKYISNNHVPYADQDIDMSIARKGIVVAGEYSGWEIVVADDRDGDTGGYYLYLKRGDVEGFDYWFEHEAGLQAQLVDFEVKWINQGWKRDRLEWRLINVNERKVDRFILRKMQKKGTDLFFIPLLR